MNNSTLLSEVQLAGKVGKLELGYTSNSITAKIVWGNFSSEINGILQFESKHVECLLSIRTSLKALEDISFHILLAQKSMPHGKSIETKVNIRFLIE